MAWCHPCTRGKPWENSVRYLGQDFGLNISESQMLKIKNRQMGLHQAKNLLHCKGNTQKMQRQLTEWKKIFTNHVADRGLILKKSIKYSGKSITKWIIQ